MNCWMSEEETFIAYKNRRKPIKKSFKKNVKQQFHTKEKFMDYFTSQWNDCEASTLPWSTMLSASANFFLSTYLCLELSIFANTFARVERSKESFCSRNVVSKWARPRLHRLAQPDRARMMSRVFAIKKKNLLVLICWNCIVSDPLLQSEWGQLLSP